MNTAIRGTACAAFLLLSSSVFAANVAPGVQIVVQQGFRTVFKGITDESGKFATAPLEPGIYRFEVRGPKTIVAARYFLALAGAKPIGEALTNPYGALGLEAEVRRPTSVRGQVRATRVIRMVAPNPTSNPAPTVAPLSQLTPTARRSSSATTRVIASSPASTQTPFANRSVTSTVAAAPVSTAYPTRSDQNGWANRPNSSALTGSAFSPSPLGTSTPIAWPNRPAVSIAPAGMSRADWARISKPAGIADSSATPGRPPMEKASNAAASESFGGVIQPRIIAGKKYRWVPIAPGSSLGRWVAEAPQPSQAQGAPARPSVQGTSSGRR